jgi:phosphatidylglycerophosphate synthase
MTDPSWTKTSTMDISETQRRPLKSRNTRWAAMVARSLARAGVRPNQISVLSIVFAAAAGSCFFFVAGAEKPGKILLLLGAAAGIQCRLLCNLFDGMVAIEGGLRSKAGEIYNELPDRFADALILIGAGYCSLWGGISPKLGWAAALLAVITAYVRALGVTAGASQQFCGPMAKPHRMALLTIASLLSASEVLLNWPLRIVPIALCLVIIGCLATIFRRTRRIVAELNSK